MPLHESVSEVTCPFQNSQFYESPTAEENNECFRKFTISILPPCMDAAPLYGYCPLVWILPPCMDTAPCMDIVSMYGCCIA